MPSASAIQGQTLTDLYAGKRVLVIGGTGFLGSVTLSMLLWRLPALGRVVVLVRKSPGLDARRRFMERILPGAAFDPVRAHLGADFERLIEDKVEVVQGDLTLPDAGIEPATVERLGGQLDLILNASGLVDFHAPLDLAHKTNVRGTAHLIDLARKTGARLVHTSTCYVAGRQDGHVAEAVVAGAFPRQADTPYLPFEAAAEDEDIALEIAMVRQRLETRPAKAKLTESAVAKHRSANGADPTASQLSNAVKRAHRDQLNADLVEAGRRRASAWGWPNVYTYTKAIAEQLLAASGVDHAIVRPAIIESALAYPLAGWNQNATTSAPLVMLALAGFKPVPAREGHVLDVIPVDMVAWSLLAAGGALMHGAAHEVYQVGTGARNPVTMGRVTELLGLYLHGRELAKGEENVKRLWRANQEPHLVQAAGFRRRAALMAKGSAWLSEKARVWGEAVVDPRARQWLEKLGQRADDTAADLEKARGLWDVFMPFSHDHDYRFATDHARELATVLAPEEAPGGFDPDGIDWRHYWLDVHVPGLEKWVLADGATGGAIKAAPVTTGLAERLEGVARHDPHRQALALYADQPGALTYGQLWHAAGLLADALRGPEGPVTIPTSSLTAWPVAVLAAWRAGRTAALVHDADTAETLVTLPTVDQALVNGRPVALGGPLVPLTPGLPEGLATTRTTFGGVTLEGRALAERLAVIGGELGIGDRDAMLLAGDLAEGREPQMMALLTLAGLYQQASLDLAAPAAWTDALEVGAPTVLVLGEAAWRAAPQQYGQGALARVARLIDLAPASPGARREPFWAAGATLSHPLWNLTGSAMVALRKRPTAEADTPYLAVAPWRLRVEAGLLEAAPGATEDWQPCGWAVTADDDGGYRLEGSGRPGPAARLEAGLLSARKLKAVALVPAQPGEHGVRVVVTPDFKRIESLQALRRHVLDEAWRHNQKAAFAERVLAVSLGEDVWLDTRQKPRHDDAGPQSGRGPGGADLLELASESRALFAPHFEASAMAFFAERLEHAPLTFERLCSWERVLVKGLRDGGLTTQGFLQAFEHELARTRTPAYKAARAVGGAISKLSGWMRDEQPEAPLLPEPVSEALRKGVGKAVTAFYRHGMHVTLHGADYLPAGENFLVVANHASHLDAGLVKYALGSWGDRLHMLAAKDYFFSTGARRFAAYHFVRFIPTDRHAASTEWLRKAREVLALGDCVVIFPEGGRTSSPDVKPFKASVGTLARQAGVPIVPIRIVGTDALLPKGAAIPRGRDAEVHIGPPIPWEWLAERTEGLGALAQDRAIAALVQEAVEGLPDKRFPWLPGWRERRIPSLGGDGPLIEAEVLDGGKSHTSS